MIEVWARRMIFCTTPLTFQPLKPLCPWLLSMMSGTSFVRENSTIRSAAGPSRICFSAGTPASADGAPGRPGNLRFGFSDSPIEWIHRAAPVRPMGWVHHVAERDLGFESTRDGYCVGQYALGQR